MSAELSRGSFRGVPFQSDTHDAALGRRLALHEFPGRDTPAVEDLGRKTRAFTLDLYVLGANYLAERDELRAALEKAGPGELVHPWLGARRSVHVQDARLTETVAEGGVARFTVTFVEADAVDAVAARVETLLPAAVDTAATAAAAQVQTDFAAAFAVTSRPAFVAAEAQSVLGQALDTLAGWRAKVPTIPAAAYQAQAAIASVSLAAADLVRAPVNLAAEAVDLVAGAADWVRQPVDALKLYESLALFGDRLAAVLGETAGRRRQRENQAALVALVRNAAVVEGARVASGLEYSSAAEALGVRDRWADLLDARGAEASDALYSCLEALRAALVRDITDRGARLPSLVAYTPAATLPSLAIAYHLYGTAGLEERAAELSARNRVRHPGFVPGGAPLEVLSA